MARSSATAAVREALLTRLAAVARTIGLQTRVTEIEGPAVGAAILALDLVRRIGSERRFDEAWLMLVGFFGRYPLEDEVLDVIRRSRTDSPLAVATTLLERHFASAGGAVARRIEIVDGADIVDVDFSAKSAHNTGIQRVVRNVAPILATTHGVTLAAWIDDNSGLRRLRAVESARFGLGVPGVREDEVHDDVLLVPWKGRLLLSEVTAFERSPLVASLARFSGTAVNAIGYDAIPIVSRENVNRREAVKFSAYLAAIKWMSNVIAISAAAAEEFGGFTDMLRSQGLAGPRVVEILLPADDVKAIGDPDPLARPLIAVVGSKEPRKNHVAVLVAAEQLWREGLDFELLFIGSYGWDTRVFRAWLTRAVKAGRPVSAPKFVDDAALWTAYAHARFTVFPSLHEGYGLPVAESLAYGTPVITSAYGSTAEIARAGGCVVVDPRDDDQLVRAMRTLLTSDSELDRLRAEARARPTSTWTDWALAAWRVVEGS
jgi:glycosyltransferase involved in cell wall biosynthesis